MTGPVGHAPPLPGDRVGPYVLGAALGVGGMATVYRATHAQGHEVALKILHPVLAAAQNLRREFYALQGLDHPHVVRVLETGRQDIWPWLAMELVDGTDLDALIAQWQRSPPADRFVQVERILRELCEALAAVHAHGLIHRDLKPSNVLLTRDGSVKLTDFGVAHALAHGDRPPERLVGTYAFMSPEQLLQRGLDPRSDLYALGAILALMLTGELPVSGDSAEAFVAGHLHQSPRPPSEIDPRVPPHLDRLALALLEKDPARRPATARQVLVALAHGAVEAPHAVLGREAELAGLLTRVRALQEGQGGLVVLRGPPGSGRSALLGELARRARSEGFDVALTSAATADPLGALAEQLPDRGGLGGQASDAVAWLTGRAGGRPWTLLLDDLDQVPLEALEDLTRLLRDQVAVAGDALLLVGAVGPSLSPALDALCGGLSTGLAPLEIPLRPLDAGSCVALVQEEGVAGRVGVVLGRRLAQEGVCQPGAIVAQLRALERDGALVRSEDGALYPTGGLEALGEGALPRLEPLPPPPWWTALGAEERGVLEALAVLGGAASREEVAGLAPISEATLEALTRAGALARTPDGALSLADPGALATLLLGLSPDQRAALHSRAAALPGRAPAAVADHLLRAGRLVEALPRLVEVAADAVLAGRLQEAEREWRRIDGARFAAEARMSPPDRERSRARSGELAEALGALRAARPWGSSGEVG